MSVKVAEKSVVEWIFYKMQTFVLTQCLSRQCDLKRRRVYRIVQLGRLFRNASRKASYFFAVVVVITIVVFLCTLISFRVTISFLLALWSGSSKWKLFTQFNSICNLGDYSSFLCEIFLFCETKESSNLVDVWHISTSTSVNCAKRKWDLKIIEYIFLSRWIDQRSNRALPTDDSLLTFIFDHLQF